MKKNFDKGCDGELHPEGMDEILTCLTCLEATSKDRQEVIEEIWEYYSDTKCGDDGCSFGCERKDIAVLNVIRMLEGQPPVEYESAEFTPTEEEEIRSEERQKIAREIHKIQARDSWDFEIRIEELRIRLENH